MSFGNFLEHPVLVGLLQKTRWNCLLPIGRKSKVVSIRKSEVVAKNRGGKLLKVPYRISFQLLVYWRNVFVVQPTFSLPIVIQTRRKILGNLFKNTGQSRQLIIRPSLLSTQCLKKYFQPLWIWLPSGLVGCSTDWKPLLENSCSICSCRRTSACHFQTPFETNCKEEKRLCKMMIKKEVLSFFFISIISLGTDILFT